MSLDDANHVGVGHGGDQHLTSGSLGEHPEQEVETGTYGEANQHTLTRREGPNDLRSERPAPEGPETGRKPIQQIANRDVEPVARVQHQTPSPTRLRNETSPPDSRGRRPSRYPRGELRSTLGTKTPGHRRQPPHPHKTTPHHTLLIVLLTL